MTKRIPVETPLRKLRESRGLTLEHVAEAVGTNSGNLSRIELAQQSVTPLLAAKLAEFYAPEINELHVFYPERYPKWEPASAPEPA